MSKVNNLLLFFFSVSFFFATVYAQQVQLTPEEFECIRTSQTAPVFLGLQSRVLFEQAGGYVIAQNELITIKTLRKVFSCVACDDNYEKMHVSEQLFNLLHTYSLEVGPNHFKDVVIADDFLMHTKQVCGPMQTLVAQLHPPTRELIVGTLFITSGLCARGDLHFESDVLFDGDICIIPGKSLLTDNIDSKTGKGIVIHDTMYVASNVCIEPSYSLSVDSIDSKSGNGVWIGDEITVEGSVCIEPTYKLRVEVIDSKTGSGVTIEDDMHVQGSVCVRDDLTIKGKLIVPGELQVSASDDVMIGQNQCLFVDCIKPLSINGTTTTQNLGVVQGKQLLVNNVVAIDSNNQPNSSGTTRFDSSICMAEHTTLSVNRITPKTLGGTLAISGASLDGADINGDVTVKASIFVDDIRLHTADAITIPSLCLDSTATLSVDHIAPKIMGDTITLADVILDSATVNGDVNILSTLFTTSADVLCDVVVRKKLFVDTIRPHGEQALHVPALCLDQGATLSVDLIAAKSDFVPVLFKGDVSLLPGGRLSADTIDPALGTVLVVDSHLSANGNINVSGGQFLQNGNPLTFPTSFSGFVADADLNMGGRSISGFNICDGTSVIGQSFLRAGAFQIHSSGQFGFRASYHNPAFPSMVIENIPFVHFWDAGIRVDGADITVDGTVEHSSDKRMKENVVSIIPQESLEKVLQLRPCTFTFKDEYSSERTRGKTQRGFIAQEVEQILPELVNIQEKAHDEFNELSDRPDNLRTMSYSHLTVDIIGALQALNQKLIDEVAQLREEIEQLRSLNDTQK